MNTDLKQYFLRLLTKRDYTTGELIEKGMQKGYTGVAVKEVIAWLEELNYVNDARYCENFVESLGHLKGRYWIVQKLRQHKIPEHLIENVMQGYEQVITPQLKKKVEQKYAIDNWNDIDPKLLQKVLNYLSRQGFEQPYDIIQQFQNF